ncbi:MAG: Rrf2 family transcriptional regulator [Maricaulaceae bacterium]|jgi:Rrf2 family iron-sulfur cluster assembly transcriptional regulator
MKLSSKGRYAVMAMADLARAGADKPVTLADIASRQQISLSYLEQLFSRLRRRGVVTSVRGPGGGYQLARPAGSINIAEIILAVDEPVRAIRCTGLKAEGCMPGGERCLTHDLWEELGERIHEFLESVSLEDVVARRVGGGASSHLGGGEVMRAAAE